MPNNELNVKITADISNLLAALASVQAEVKAASENMAAAQAAFGKAAELGNEQATGALTDYSAALAEAQARVDALAASQQAAATSLIRPQTASREFASWREAAGASTPAEAAAPAAAGALPAVSAPIAVAEAPEAAAEAVPEAVPVAAGGGAPEGEDTSAIEAATEANTELAASETAVAESTAIASTAFADQTAFANTQAEAAARQTTAVAAYNKAAARSAEVAELMGKAFDDATAAGMGFVEALDAAVDAAAAFDEAELSAAASAATQAASMRASGLAAAGSVSGTMAASGALRVMEGSMMGATRAGASFLSTTLGLGPVLEAAFPIIGAAALLSILVELGEKIYDVWQKATQAGDAIATAFEAANDQIRDTTDSIELENSKLQDQIDKLEGHPSNGLATTLLEAKDAADKLQRSLDADTNALDALLKKHEVGTLAGLLTGTARTAPLDQDLKQQAEGIDEQARVVTRKYDEAITASNGDAAKLHAADQEHADQLKALYDKAAAELQPSLDHYLDLQRKNNEAQAAAKNAPREVGIGGIPVAGAAPVDTDYSPPIAALQGQIERYKDIAAEVAAMAAQQPLQERKGRDEQAKEGAEAASKAEEKHLHDLEAAFAEEELLYGKSANAAAAYWDQYLGTFKEGSSEYNTVAEKVVAARAELGKKQPESQVDKGLKKTVEEAKKDAAEYQHALDEMTKARAELFKAQQAAGTEQQGAALGFKDPAAAHQQILDQMEEVQAKGQATSDLSIIKDPEAQLSELRAFHQRVIQEQERFVNQEIAIASDNREVEEVRKLEKQLEEIRHQGSMEWIKDTEKATAQVEKQIEQATQKMQQDFNHLFAETLSGQETWANAAIQLYKQVSTTFIENVMKMAEQYAVGLATQKAGNLSAIESSAATAAANTYASVSAIPVVGWLLAPPAAAAAFASVLAFQAFEAGGIVEGMHGMPVPIVAHAGERVLSSMQTQNFERLVDQSPRTGSTVNLHYNGQVNAFDRNGMRSALRSHAEDILGIVREGINTGRLGR